MRIATNVCRDMQRTRWFRHVDRRITPEMLPEPIVRNSYEDVELLMSVTDLPVKLKEVIILYYYQGMTLQEIAHVLGITESSVSIRLKKAKGKLRDELGRRNCCE